MSLSRWQTLIVASTAKAVRCAESEPLVAVASLTTLHSRDVAGADHADTADEYATAGLVNPRRRDAPPRGTQPSLTGRFALGLPAFLVDPRRGFRDLKANPLQARQKAGGGWWG